MSIVAHSHPYVIGVDTHARNHAYAILAAATGELIDSAQFPTTTAGMRRALNWAAKRTGGDLDVLWVIEGAASYGARLAGSIAAEGYAVAEASRMNARATRGVGKSDPLDARRIAAAVLPLEVDDLRRPRLDEGTRAALQVLATARESITAERTRAVNALTAVLRVHDLGMDARKPLTRTQIADVSRWRTRDEDLARATARSEAVRQAGRILALDDELETNTNRMSELVEISEAAPLLNLKGVGPVTAAVCLTAWSHHGRLRSEAAFASLSGVSPIPASSGNTVRHRLNRGGDRRVNRALHLATVTRMTHDDETRAYVEKRRAEGRTNREIRRCLKRYLARRIYRTLSDANTEQNAA